MNYKTHNDQYINCGGTYGQGQITATYAQLKKKFGEPTPSDEYKSDAEWEVQFEDGVVATIYNWKNGKNYLGANGIATTKITDWNIGGNDQRAVSNVKVVLGA